MSEESTSLEERAKQAILENAFMRTESAIVLAGTIVGSAILFLTRNAAAIPDLSFLVTALGGMAAYGGLAWVSFNDDAGNAKVVERVLTREYDPSKIRQPRLQVRINEALGYRSKMTTAITQRDQSALKVQLESVASQFDLWIEEIYDLAERIDAYEVEKPQLKRSYERAQKRTRQLEARLERTRDSSVRAEIENNLASSRKQMETIASLQNTMQRAELRLENTVTAMSTIYSQTLLLDAKDIDSSRYRRLQQEIEEEVEELADVLYSMDEVYSEGAI